MKALREIKIGFQRMSHAWFVVIGAGFGAGFGATPAWGLATGAAFAALFAWAYSNEAR